MKLFPQLQDAGDICSLCGDRGAKGGCPFCGGTVIERVDLMSMWWLRFLNRMDAYAKQGVKSGHCQYFAKYQDITPALFERHLSGLLTLGLPALDQNGFSRWCCFDSDKDDGNLDKIEKLLIQYNWHYVREGIRPGRDGHLWLFFSQPILASDLRLIGRRFIEAAGIAPNSIEFFPKQDMPSYDSEKQRFKASSIVRLPLGIHRKPGVDDRGWFRDAPRDLDSQLKYICDQPYNPIAPVQLLAEELKLEAEKNAIKHPVSQWANTGNRRDAKLALSRISPDLSYPHWIQVGMALHSAGLPFEMWEQWSAKSVCKYKPGDSDKMLMHWKTFIPEANDSRKRVGIGTLFHFANNPRSIAI